MDKKPPIVSARTHRISAQKALLDMFSSATKLPIGLYEIQNGEIREIFSNLIFIITPEFYSRPFRQTGEVFTVSLPEYCLIYQTLIKNLLNGLIICMQLINRLFYSFFTACADDRVEHLDGFR